MTGLEPATSGVTGRRSNQLSYTRAEPTGIAKARLICAARNRVNGVRGIQRREGLDEGFFSRMNLNSGTMRNGV